MATKVIGGRSGSSAPAAYFPLQQAITADQVGSPAFLALRVAHEAFHASSYHAAQIINRPVLKIFNRTESKPYRAGIEMMGRQEEANYFSLAEEAIIAKLSRRFFDDVVAKHPAYKEEVERTGVIKRWITSNTPEERIKEMTENVLLLPDNELLYSVLTSDIAQDEKWAHVRSYMAREETLVGLIMSEAEIERKKFDAVLDKIVNNSKGKIENKEELFDEFARAHFSGNYLSLARTVEASLGKGSFRKVALELGDIHTESLKKWYGENSLDREKPPFLYHGTLDDSIAEFEPRAAKERPDEEPAVYASPDLEIAAQSMANEFVSNGGILNGRKFICIPMPREEFLKQDHGGVIYKLPSDSFDINEGRGFNGDKEWVSKTAVKPLSYIRFPSLLQRMLAQQTEVYFIEPKLVPIITEAQNDPKELETILASLKSEK